MKTVLENPAPKLAPMPDRRSADMVDFVNSWYVYIFVLNYIFILTLLLNSLTKNFEERPKYDKLLDHPFLVCAAADRDIALLREYFSSVLDAMGKR